MSTRDLGIVAITLIGVWMLAQAVVGLAGLCAFALDPESDASLGETFNLYQVLSISAYAAVGGTLVFLRYVIAKAWLPESVLREEPSEQTIASVLFAVMGIWLMANAFIDTIYHETDLLIITSMEYGAVANSQAWPPRARALATFVIGFALFSKPEGLLHSWHWLREARWYRQHDPPAA